MNNKSIYERIKEFRKEYLKVYKDIKDKLDGVCYVPDVYNMRVYSDRKIGFPDYVRKYNITRGMIEIVLSYNKRKTNITLTIPIQVIRIESTEVRKKFVRRLSYVSILKTLCTIHPEKSNLIIRKIKETTEKENVNIEKLLD